MKKALSILALVLVLVLSVSLFAACGGDKKSADTGSAEAESPKGETQTWGNITIFVPEGYTLNGGDSFDAEDPDKLTLNLGDSFRNYVMVKAGETEEMVTGSVAGTKEMNEGAEDFTLTAGSNNWTGVTYDAYGTPCFMVYSQIGDGYVLVNGAGYTSDDAAFREILSSIVIAAAE